MSDMVRDFMEAPFVVITDEEILNRRKYQVLALKALDAEREAHAKEVSDLRTEIACYQRALDGSSYSLDLRDREIADLRKCIEELTAQLQDEVIP